MVQWLRIFLPMQGPWIWLLVGDNPPGGGVTGAGNCRVPSLEPDLHRRRHRNEKPVCCGESSRYSLRLECVQQRGPWAAPKEKRGVCLPLARGPVRGGRRLARFGWESCGHRSSDFWKGAGLLSYALHWRRVELRQGVKMEHGQMNWL